MTPDDALTLRTLIWANEDLMAEYEAQGRRAEAAIARRRLAACTKKLAEIEAAAADMKDAMEDEAAEYRDREHCETRLQRLADDCEGD